VGAKFFSSMCAGNMTYSTSVRRCVCAGQVDLSHVTVMCLGGPEQIVEILTSGPGTEVTDAAETLGKVEGGCVGRFN
jgi:hypothetical protein